jgi:hypothetical protein
MLGHDVMARLPLAACRLPLAVVDVWHTVPGILACNVE